MDALRIAAWHKWDAVANSNAADAYEARIICRNLERSLGMTPEELRQEEPGEAPPDNGRTADLWFSRQSSFNDIT